ncbi:MAG: hypothetical protein IT379_22190 [Deltaproteobacteria bacterium]|nr:hypothetical protein [Deltaproteobacteria bacterium]
MSASITIGHDVLDELTELASRWTGFRADAVHRTTLGRRLQKLLSSGDELERFLARARAGERSSVAALAEAVSVGETYFFRQGEHFDWLARCFSLERIVSRRGVVRAWSAGCATGEEAWSIASFLRAHVATGAKVEVLGTDLVERNLVAAAHGVYPRRSSRTAPRYPVTHEDAAGRLVVAKHLRPLATFATHNLLDPLPSVHGLFDIVLCRNVLVYLSADAASRVCAHLRRALAPEGVIVFAPADLASAQPGLVLVSPPELCVYGHARTTGSGLQTGEAAARPETRRPASPRARAATSEGRARPTARGKTSSGSMRAVTRPPAPAPTPTPHPDRVPGLGEGASARTSAGADPEPPAVALHVAALDHIERGDLRRAAAALAELETTAPGYLPGLLECALFHQRVGRRDKAERLMRTLLARTRQLPPEMRVPGPEEMPVVFYATSARAFLEGKG